MPDEHGKKADAPTPLARRIGFPLLTCYGLGTILGAGIYVLVGKVAGESGLLAPLAFLLAAFIASITALRDVYKRQASCQVPLPFEVNLESFPESC